MRFSRVFDYDEVIREDTNLESLAALRPAFDPRSGTVTAGNASGIVDAAASLIVTTAEHAKANGYAPRAKIRRRRAQTLEHWADLGQPGPGPAIRIDPARAG